MDEEGVGSDGWLCTFLYFEEFNLRIEKRYDTIPSKHTKFLFDQAVCLLIAGNYLYRYITESCLCFLMGFQEIYAFNYPFTTKRAEDF